MIQAIEDRAREETYNETLYKRQGIFNKCQSYYQEILLDPKPTPRIKEIRSRLALFVGSKINFY